ncbi:MAG TPA: hypothetical protein VF322_09475 [Gammaproteobacteria bacterium]
MAVVFDAWSPTLRFIASDGVPWAAVSVLAAVSVVSLALTAAIAYGKDF